MTRWIEAGEDWKFGAFADCGSFAEHEAAGVSIASLVGAIRDGLSKHGTDIRVAGPDISRRTASDDTLSVLISLRASARVSTDVVGASILAALNKPTNARRSSVRPFVSHVPASYAAAAALAMPVALPLAVVATAANWITSTVAERAHFTLPRPFGFVIDESTFARGTLPAGAVPPSTSTFVGQLLSAPNSVASADRERDGRTNGGIGLDAVKDAAGRGAGESLIPGWVMPVAVTAAVIVGVVAVGYAARGIADVARET